MYCSKYRIVIYAWKGQWWTNNMKEFCISFDFDGTLYDYMPPYPIVASKSVERVWL